MEFQSESNNRNEQLLMNVAKEVLEVTQEAEDNVILSELFKREEVAADLLLIANEFLEDDKVLQFKALRALAKAYTESLDKQSVDYKIREIILKNSENELVGKILLKLLGNNLGKRFSATK